MTTLSAQSLGSFGVTAQRLENAFQIALGILAEAARPLGASPYAGGCFPAAARVSAGTVPNGSFEPAASWTTAMTGTSTAKIDLGDGYRLDVDERNSELTIINDATGQRTRIWGDPHVEVNGQHKFDFWGTTTFTLPTGTKITINTEQWAGNPNMYVASQVVVTKGANAIVIDGISQNRIGDLSITNGMNGYALDSAHRDGYVLNQRISDGGWDSEWTGRDATQQDLNATRPGEAFGPGADTLSLGEASGALSLFLFAGSLGSLFNLLGGPRIATEQTERFQPREANRPRAITL